MAPAPRSHRRSTWLAGIAVALVLLVAMLAYLAQPQRSTRLVLDRVGAALGLEITASSGQLGLSGTPSLVVTGLVAREPGATQALLKADRIALSVPWSTIRSRGNALTIQRVELDRPVLDVPALQHWLARRPSGKTHVPVLTNGLEARNGSVRGIGWSIDALDLAMPTLAPAGRITAHASGRYRSGSLQLPFALALAMSSAAPDATIGLAGDLAIERPDWRIPARVMLSGQLRGNGGLRLERAKLSAAARYEAGTTRAPFDLGVGGILRLGTTTQLIPAAIAIRASGLVPTLDATGLITVADALDIELAGRLSRWPTAWPQLPAPLSKSTSPLPFRLRYTGDTGLGGVAELALHLDDATFDGRFHVADIGAWISSPPGGSPLPPLDGRITARGLDIPGARLEGVDMTFDDPGVGDAPPPAQP